MSNNVTWGHHIAEILWCSFDKRSTQGTKGPPIFLVVKDSGTKIHHQHLRKRKTINLVGGFNPPEKYEFVRWDDEIPNIWKIIKFMFQTTNQGMIHNNSRGNIPIFRKSSHTMFSSYSRPGFWYVTLIGISAQSGGNSWATANPLNAPPQLSIPYVVPKRLWTLNELKAALIRKFLHLSTEEGQGCQG